MSVADWGGLGQWRTRTTFVLALSAAVVGLGSLWRFAWLMGTHGGGAFMLAYVVSLFLLAVPLMVAEVVVGSYGRGSPPLALRWVVDRSLLSRHWMWLGVLASLTGLIILSYQVVVAGWALAYTSMLQGNEFSAASAPQISETFSTLLQDPQRQLGWQSLFIGAVVLVSGQGIRRGLGAAFWLIVPVLMTLLAVLVKFNLDNGNLGAAGEFLFSLKEVDISRETLVAALGHALLTLGVGVGVGMIYGAYAPRRIPIGRSVLAVAVFEIAVALLAGLAIYPLVLASNMEPAAGPGLLFISAPYAFGNTLHGELFGSLFFGMIVIAALGTALALMEPAVAMVRQALVLPRPVAVVVVGVAVWALSCAVTLSLQGEGWFANYNLMHLFDQLAAGVLLPLVSLLLAVLVGWRLDRRILREQFNRESDLFFSLWLGLLRYIAPLALLAILLQRYFH